MAYTPPDWSGPLRHALSLEFVVGGQVKKRQELPTGKDYFLCGRHAKQCDVVLDAEPKASRVHAVLQCKEGSDELFVFDLGSSHGTMLNNKLIEPKTYTPLAVGHQLRFCSEGSQCLVLLCGPEELMEEEGEVDLADLREQTQQERRAAEQDLLKRKAAKKERLMKEKTRQAVADMYAEKARRKQQQMQDELEKDLGKLHEVTWGMDADAVDMRDDGLTEEGQKLLDKAENGWIDAEKVRTFKTLTEKQEQMVAKFEQKKRKLENLQREKLKLEGRIKKSAMHATGDDDTEFDPVSRPEREGPSSEQFSRVEQKIYTVQEDVIKESDNVLISLGLKTAEMSRKQKKERAAMYDTNVMRDEDDDFFDRTADAAKAHKKAQASKSKQGPRDEDDEFIDLPQIGQGVETKESLEQKVKLLQSERAHLEAKVAMTEIAVARYGSDNADSLDAFMMGNEQQLVTERLAKLKRRHKAVGERLVEATKMLAVAQRNSAGAPSVASVVAAAAATAAKKAQAPPAKATPPPAKVEVVAAAPQADVSEEVSIAAAESPASTTEDAVDKKDAEAGKIDASGEVSTAPAEQTSAAPLRPVVGKRVYGAAPAVHIDPNCGGLQYLAPPAAPKRQKVGPAAPPPGSTGVSDGSILEEPAAVAAPQTAEASAPPTKRIKGPTLPPPGALQQIGANATHQGAQTPAKTSEGVDGSMPPPKRKVYGAAPRPPVAVSPSRDSDEHFE